MKSDWIWAWLGGLPAVIVAAIVIKSTGLSTGSPLMAALLMTTSAAIVAIGTLWLRNQSSIRRLRRSGGEVELIVRPVDALLRGALHFPTFFGVTVLLRLLIHGPAIEWGQAIAFSGVLSFIYALTMTAYRKAE
jgi:hypothetical protein